MEVVKQRRQVRQFNSSLLVVKDILKNEGLRGFYRGYSSTVARDMPFSAIQFPVWELLKKLWSDYQGYYVNSWQSSVCGALSGISNTIIIYIIEMVLSLGLVCIQ